MGLVWPIMDSYMCASKMGHRDILAWDHEVGKVDPPSAVLQFQVELGPCDSLKDNFCILLLMWGTQIGARTQLIKSYNIYFAPEQD